MKMKIPSNNAIGNGYYNYGETYMLDSTGNENGTPANSSSLDECDSPTTDGDFSEYMWMENEEEFDKEVMQQLEEEALMEQCIEAMLEDELTSQEESQWSNANSNENNVAELNQQMTGLKVQEDKVELVKSSKLNPLAAEFVPSPRSSQQQQQSSTETSSARMTSS